MYIVLFYRENQEKHQCEALIIEIEQLKQEIEELKEDLKLLVIFRMNALYILGSTNFSMHADTAVDDINDNYAICIYIYRSYNSNPSS